MNFPPWHQLAVDDEAEFGVDVPLKPQPVRGPEGVLASNQGLQLTHVLWVLDEGLFESIASKD